MLLSQRHDALLGQVVEFVETTKKQWISVAKGDVPSSDAAIVPACLGMIPTASIIAGIVYTILTVREWVYGRRFWSVIASVLWS